MLLLKSYKSEQNDNDNMYLCIFALRPKDNFKIIFMYIRLILSETENEKERVRAKIFQTDNITYTSNVCFLWRR